MSKRIRYKEFNKGEYRSIDIFKSKRTGAEYRVYLDLNTLTFKILNINKQLFINSGGENINNLNVLKRVAKQYLQKLGVEFESELRDRSFGLCKKGYTQDEHSIKEIKKIQELS